MKDKRLLWWECTTNDLPRIFQNRSRDFTIFRAITFGNVQFPHAFNLKYMVSFSSTAVRCAHFHTILEVLEKNFKRGGLSDDELKLSRLAWLHLSGIRVYTFNRFEAFRCSSGSIYMQMILIDLYAKCLRRRKHVTIETLR